MSQDGQKSEEWYRSRIDRLMAHHEALDLAFIQMNASLVQLCARLVESARPNETQMLLSLLPMLSKTEVEDPKITAHLQRIAESLRKDDSRKPEAKPKDA